MSHKIIKQMSMKPNSHAKAKIKEAMYAAYKSSGSKKASGFSLGWLTNIPRPAVVLSMIAILFLSTVLGVALARNPLTAEKVIASALETIDENQRKGQWQFTKTKEEITINGKTLTSFTEMWADTNMTTLFAGIGANSEEATMNYSTRTTLEDGRIIFEDVTVDGKSYTRDTRDVMKEVLGFDPYSYSSENFDMSNVPLPTGFKEAGLTYEAFETMSMKEIDDALKAAGQKAMHEPMYKTTDFPAYTMKPSDIAKLYERYEELVKEDPEYFDKLYGGKDNYRDFSSDFVVTPEGQTLEGDAAQNYFSEQQSTFQSIDALRTGTLEDKKKALEALQQKGGAKLITGAKWDGRPVVGIDISQAYQGPVELMSMSEIIYLDPKSYQLVGEEMSFNMNDSIIPQAGMFMPSKIRVTYLQQFFTQIKPTFSIEGLIPTEQLYADMFRQ